MKLPFNAAECQSRRKEEIVHCARLSGPLELRGTCPAATVVTHVIRKMCIAIEIRSSLRKNCQVSHTKSWEGNKRSQKSDWT